jgi:type II secretion system protein I
MSRIGSNRGFTLVEVLLTIAILAIGLIGIIMAYSSLLNAAGVSYEYIDAVCLAKEKMAEIELDELQNKDLTKGTVKGEALGIYEDFNWEKTIEPSDDKKLNIVSVAVFKKDDIRSRRFILETYAYSKE